MCQLRLQIKTIDVIFRPLWTEK